MEPQKHQNIRPLTGEHQPVHMPEAAPLLNKESIIALENTHAVKDFEKVAVLLAASGDKPVSFVVIESPFWEFGGTPQEVSDDDDAEFRAVADGLGLYVRSADRVLQPSDSHKGVVIRNMVISRSPELAESVHAIVSDSIGARKADGTSGFVYDERTLGTLLGFPDSAVEAYAEGRSHTGITHISDLEIHAFARYALSDENEAEELRTGKRWAASVKRLSPYLYNKEMDETAAYLKETGVAYVDPRRTMGRLYARLIRGLTR